MPNLLSRPQLGKNLKAVRQLRNFYADRFDELTAAPVDSWGAAEIVDHCRAVEAFLRQFRQKIQSQAGIR